MEDDYEGVLSLLSDLDEGPDGYSRPTYTYDVISQDGSAEDFNKAPPVSSIPSHRVDQGEDWIESFKATFNEVYS